MADVQDYIDHVLADSPLLYWPLQQTSGDAQDATSNDRDGVLTGGVWAATNPVASRGDKCFSLPAGSSGSTYLTYTGDIDTNAGTGLTVEFWLRQDVSPANSPPVLWSGDGATKFACILSTSTGSIRFSTSGSTGRITLTNSAALGRWVYWVFTQDAAGNSRVYRNGVLAAGPTTQTVGADFTDFKLSNAGSATAVTMWQHVAVFNTELSAARIAERWELQVDELHSFVSIRQSEPASFATTPLVPLGTRVIGSQPPTEGQLWPRGSSPINT